MTLYPAAAARTPHAGGIVSCTIAGDQFAFRASDACEIVRAEKVRRAPGPDNAVGTIEMNGEAVPVYPLDAALGRPAGRAGSGRVAGHVVITRGRAGSAGWLVDRITRSAVQAMSPAPLPPMVGPLATRWFEGLLRVGERLLLLIAPEDLDPRSGADAGAPARVQLSAPPAGSLAPGPEDQGPPLAVLFFSPALPRCGAPQCALSARRIAAVIQSAPVITVPGSARHIAGVVMWRDEAVPVIDVREAHGRPAPEHARFIVARCGSGGHVAFECAGGVMLHQPTRQDRQIEDGPVAPFVTGVFGIAGDPVALLDLDAMLAAFSQPS